MNSRAAHRGFCKHLTVSKDVCNPKQKDFDLHP